MRKALKIVLTALLCAVIVLGPFGMSEQNVEAATTGPWDFSYTGAVQPWSAPAGGTYKLEVWGARGGVNNGGLGGYSVGNITLAAGTNVYVYVGGQGSSASGVTGGFNGGGSAHRYTEVGGGATDIRISTDSLYNRVIVAGGGGGNGSAAGGYGGGTTGGNGANGCGYLGTGGAQTSGGSGGSQYGAAGTFGQGGSNTGGRTGEGGGGGGGGWYGGGAGGNEGFSYNDDDDSGGGGGSGFALTSGTVGSVPSGYALGSQYYLTGASTTAGNQSFTSPSGTSETGHSGSGYARITLLSTSAPTVSVSSPTANQMFSSVRPITLSGTVNDAFVGSILTIYYRIDGSAGQAGTQVSGTVTADGTNQAFTNTTIDVSSLVDGNHTLYVWVTDNLIDISAETAIPFIKDNTPPTGSIMINKQTDGTGAVYTNSSPLSLSLSATDNISNASQMKMFISYNGTTPIPTTGATTGVSTGWIAYNTTYSWPYTGADGNVTVYAWFMDADNNISTRYSDDITFDKTAPTGSIIINKKVDGTGAEYTNISPLNLSLSATDNISTTSQLKMFISYSSTTPTPTTGATTGVSSGWIAYNTTYSWPYTGVDGDVPVYVWFMDLANNISAKYSDDIIFDSTPVAGTVTINANSSTIYRYNATSQLDFTSGSAADPLNSVIVTSTGSVQLNGTTSGTYISPMLNIGSVGKVGASVIEWRDIVPTGTTLEVDTRYSLAGSNATSWSSWATATKNKPIQGLASGMDLTGVWIQYRVIMTSNSTSVTPLVNDMIINIVPPSATTLSNATVTLTFTKAPIYADVNQVIVSNYPDFSVSQTFTYATDVQNNTLQWTMNTAGSGSQAVYAKYVDWAGNTSSVFSDASMFDTTPPSGTMSINGGATSTNQPTVTLFISATDDTSSASDIQMMISNDQNFTGAIWEALATTKSWPLDSASSGTKTVYIKFKDKVGNTSNPISATIQYSTTGTGGGTGTGTGGGGTSVINNYITYSFLSDVQHEQAITLPGDGTLMYVKSPTAPAQSYTLSEYNDLLAHNIFYNQDWVSYRLAFDITDDNAKNVNDIEVDLRYNDYSEDGIEFVPSSIQLKKLINGSYMTIKDLTPSYTKLAKNRFIIGFGNDNGGMPMIIANGGGSYALDYSGTLIVKNASWNTPNETVTVRNEALIRIFTGAGGYTEFVEPERSGKQFYIETLVSRWNAGTH